MRSAVDTCDIILAEVNENRLKQAAAFGIDVLVNPGSENLAEIVLKHTDGIGADVVIDHSKEDFVDAGAALWAWCAARTGWDGPTRQV